MLTIAGSDSSGGAGVQADLKTFAAHGLYGLCALTAVTAQNTVEVRTVAGLAPALVAAQIDAVLDDLGADAVKIGMLGSAAIVRIVAARLRAHFGVRQVPIVLDPVLAAGTGRSLLIGASASAAATLAAVVDEIADAARLPDGAEAEMLAALREELLPLVTLVTPNVPELARLVGDSTLPVGEAARLALARRLLASGASVLAKGGHDPGAADSPAASGVPGAPGPSSPPRDWSAAGISAPVVDLLLVANGAAGNGEAPVLRFVGRRLGLRTAHGTGCTLAAAIAARLAGGEGLAAAVGGGIEYVRGAILAAVPLGGGDALLDHFHDRSHGSDARAIQEPYGE